jgi:serine/threonine-protein phosphatase 4 regulatory subunit 1
MANPDLSSMGDGEISFSCAYNLPALLYTFGKTLWPKLLDVYIKLVRLPDKRVKRSLASSIHELATMLGPDITESHLLPVL